MVNHVYWPASRLLRRVVAACTGLLPITGGSGGRCASGVCTARAEGGSGGSGGSVVGAAPDAAGGAGLNRSLRRAAVEEGVADLCV